MHERRLFITGDIHGQYKEVTRLKKFCNTAGTNHKDIMFILGDVGVNYYLDARDEEFKRALSSCPITFMLLRGNHECRPENIDSYVYVDSLHGGYWYEEKYPTLRFLDNGVHYINDLKFLVINGAYSVDKYYRLARGWKWFEDEQLNDQEKAQILYEIEQNNSFDYILSHTCPLNYEPRKLFLPQIDQATVDKSMEIFLQQVYEKLSPDFRHWYCGHYHDDTSLSGKIRLVYNDIFDLR